MRMMVLKTTLIALAAAYLCGDLRAADPPSVKDELIVEAGLFGSTKALLMVPPEPKALALLIAGGQGNLQLKGSDGMVAMGPLQWNFLVRSRAHFHKRDIAVLLVDSPNGRPMTYMDRTSATSHFQSLIEKAIARSPVLKDLPVWGVATSAGSISLAAWVNAAPERLSGAVFTAPITRGVAPGAWGPANPQGIASKPLRFSKPVLVVVAANDACSETPPGDAEMLLSRFEASTRKQAVMIQNAGNPAGDPCQAQSPHGFWDVEDETVGRIVDFMLAQ